MSRHLVEGAKHHIKVLGVRQNHVVIQNLDEGGFVERVDNNVFLAEIRTCHFGGGYERKRKPGVGQRVRAGHPIAGALNGNLIFFWKNQLCVC